WCQRGCNPEIGAGKKVHGRRPVGRRWNDETCRGPAAHGILSPGSSRRGISVATDLERQPLTTAQRAELERRVAAADANPTEGVTGEVDRAGARGGNGKATADPPPRSICPVPITPPGRERGEQSTQPDHS